MSRRLDWDRANRRDQLHSEPEPRPDRAITRAQASYLTNLLGRPGEPFAGVGDLTAQEASLAIGDALGRLRASNGARRRK